MQSFIKSNTKPSASAADAASTWVAIRGDDRLSRAEAVLMFAAFSTLLCSMMLGVIIP